MSGITANRTFPTGPRPADACVLRAGKIFEYEISLNTAHRNPASLNDGYADYERLIPFALHEPQQIFNKQVKSHTP